MTLEVDTDFRGDGAGRGLVVAGEQNGRQPERAQRRPPPPRSS